MEDISTLPSPCLEIRDLRVVLALAGSGTTAGAARILHLTQPAVSRALAGIEERLGTRLFERGPRGVALTEVGLRLIAGARHVLVELADLERSVRAPRARPVRLRLVCECYTAYHWLPSVLAKLRTDMPDLQIELAVEHTDAPVAALESARIDVALLTTATLRGGTLESQPLFADEIVFVVSSSHPLAAKKALAPSDLEAYPLYAGRVPDAEASWFRAAVFGRRRVRLRLEGIPLTEAILDCARAGLGIAVLSEWIARPHLDKRDLVARRLRSGPLRRPWRIAFRPEVAEAARRLASALQATVPSGYPLD